MNNTARRAIHILLPLIVMAIGPVFLAAFTMEPMVATLSPAGAKSITTFRFKNDGDQAIALRVRMVTRDIGADGTETNQPATEQFDVYPARLVVGANGTASVKVRWKGPVPATGELAFRFIAEQVPVNTGNGPETGLKVMFRYVASLYVGLPSFMPDIRATAVAQTGTDGRDGFLVTIHNQGKKHVVIQDLRLEITGSDNQKTELSAPDVGKLTDRNYLPGTTQQWHIPHAMAGIGRTYEVHPIFEASD